MVFAMPGQHIPGGSAPQHAEKTRRRERRRHAETIAAIRARLGDGRLFDTESTCELHVLVCSITHARMSMHTPIRATQAWQQAHVCVRMHMCACTQYMQVCSISLRPLMPAKADEGTECQVLVFFSFPLLLL